MIFYKRKYTIFCLLSIFTFSALLLFKFFLPAKRGATTVSPNNVIFSRDSGFYEDAFELELGPASGTIYYTLDGSIPDKGSLKYEAPILISDASDNDNCFSTRTDVSTGFEQAEIERLSSDPPGYQVPGYNIDKATVIRAVSYDNAGNKSEIKTAVYFVGFSSRNGYDGMNIISIITAPSNLFDYETGIYVTGKTYDEYIKKYRGSEYYWREEFWTLWSANYRNRGKKWERDAVCQFFDENGQQVLEQKCGIRIHGGASRGYNPKSLNIYARKEYDGNPQLQYDLFGTGYYPSAVTLSQGGNDIRTKSKDYLIAASTKDLNFSTMNHEPYVLFLNGEYWGIYWLNEKYDARYLDYYYGVSKDNVIIIKEGVLEDGDEDDYKFYSKMIDFCSQSDVSIDANYKKVCELIDMNSYIDYYAVMLFIGRNGDWPSGNYALWRVKKKESSEYGDGKWRWMLFDLNSPGFDICFDPIEYTMENDGMFKNLMTNNTFRTQLLQRIREIANANFSPEIMEQRINRYKEFISDPMKENDKRFFNDDSLAVFDLEMKELNNFFTDRMTYLEPILEGYE